MEAYEDMSTHMNSQVKETRPLGLYVHVPFCASTCDFCAFYQEKPRRGDLDRYLKAMEFEFSALPKDRVIETVFWGGGTPGLLSAKDLEQLGCAQLEKINKPPIEWTIEMAPSTVKADKLAVLQDLGVTRISMGVQSFNAQLLASLGRLHQPKQIYKAWERIQAASFPHTNLDLIFGIPNQTLGQWEADIREAASLGPDHISTYCLTFEEDTAMYLKLSQGKVRIDDERDAKFYERGWELLAELGYAQYEISNFAKPKGECRHNLNTWQMHEWLGCGPSAASQYRMQRYQRPSNLDQWLSGVEKKALLREELVDLNDTLLLADGVIFGLRMNAGIDLVELQQRFPMAQEPQRIQGQLKRLCEGELAIKNKNRYCLTQKGQLLADAIAVEFM
ncbi:MAG: Oxygen-independent coproporphyrinogen-III oxidase-like protein [Opitutia bacterium UBA7350]|nr:MAG: Oxygen-independent coproporphyrinogen-III oxidase-like protein [Opitutae bacterium UBA7350]